MTQTLLDYKATTTWQSANALSGIPIGDPFYLRSKGLRVIIISEGIEPAADDLSGEIAGATRSATDRVTVETGSMEVWFRTYLGETPIHIGAL